jgi:hypothetical protein
MVAAEEEPPVLFAEREQALVWPAKRRPGQFELIGGNDERRALRLIPRRGGSHADDRIGSLVQQRGAAETTFDEEPRQRVSMPQKAAVFDRRAELADRIHPAVLPFGKALGPERLAAMRGDGAAGAP